MSRHKQLPWQPIATAPQDGTAVLGRYVCADPHTGVLRYTKRRTWWGKTSHVPLYGWCHGTDIEDIDLWEPTSWLPICSRCGHLHTVKDCPITPPECALGGPLHSETIA